MTDLTNLGLTSHTTHRRIFYAFRADPMTTKTQSLFDRAFDLEQIEAGNASDATNPPGTTRFRGSFPRGWAALNGRMGGNFVCAYVVRAMIGYSKPLGYPDPVSVHFDFHSAANSGSSVEVVVKTTRRGKSYLFLEATLFQVEAGNNAPISVIACHGVFGVLPKLKDGIQLRASRFTNPKKPSLPRNQCVNPFDSEFYKLSVMVPRDGALLSMVDVMKVWTDPATLEAASEAAQTELAGGPSAGLDLNGSGWHWVGFSDGREHDAISAVFWLDLFAWNFYVRNHIDQQKGITRLSTILSIAIHFYAAPEGQIMLRRDAAGLVSVGSDGSGMMDEELELWDEQGEKIVALARQTWHIVESRKDAKL